MNGRIRAGLFAASIFFSIGTICSGVESRSATQKGKTLAAELAAGMEFRAIGPALSSGRISDVVIHPRRRATWYVAAASGGVWKTEDAGSTWNSIFDHESSYSIGCLAVDPLQPEVVWVGTGENVSGRHVGFGDGVYKSLDNGRTWKNMGLKKTEHIGKILLDPRAGNVVYVAAEGPLWAEGGERGVFKSNDGGITWQPSLQISRDTGVCDLAMEPGNPEVLYAAAYQRRRSVAAFMAGGPEGGIYKSENGGRTWRKLAGGLPGGDVGRIGLAISPQQPNVVYATIEAAAGEQGFYRSCDRGESWEKRSTYLSNGTGPHYYQEIYADPHRFDRVYQNDVWLHVSDDGGKTFREVEGKSKHSDNHALAFDPREPGYLLAGCDGGLYESWNGGRTWRYFANMPLTQFYKVALDNALPFYNIHGGTQDNGTQSGPARTANSNGILPGDWRFTLGADGYSCAVDPADPDTVYASWQVGSLVRCDRKSGETIAIQPQVEAAAPPQRWNWDSPLLVSPHAAKRLYYASQFLFRSDDRGDSWQRLSPDLTKGVFRLEQPIMGRRWSADALWDHDAMSYFGSVTALSESPLVEGLIYAGTDDGLIQVSEDGGGNWRRIDRLPGVPSGFFVNDIKACRHDRDTVFAAVDNHKAGDFKPYLLKSSDRGRTWTSLAADLPDRHLLWSIAQDAARPGLLFVGSEFGVFFTLDGGGHWHKFNRLPTVSFRDIEVQDRECDLVASSFGRGIFILDDYSPLRHTGATADGSQATLFAPRRALSYIPAQPLNLAGKGFQGDDLYLAPNPPFGAVFTYFLPDSLKSSKKLRLEKEKELRRQGIDIPFPGWETLRREDDEEEPVLLLTVRDLDGNVVRRLKGPNNAGVHFVAWDLRYPDVEPVRLQEEAGLDPWDSSPRGPLVVPGTFRVTLEKAFNGAVTQLSEAQECKVESLGLAALRAEERQEVLAFQQKAGRLQRAMIGAGAALDEALKRLEFIKKAIMEAPGADSGWGLEARRLEGQLRQFRSELIWDRTLGKRSEPQRPSLLQRLDAQLGSTSVIRAGNRGNYGLVAATFSGLLEKMRLAIDVELRRLEAKLDAAGVPWTPGREVPRWEEER
ncbi:MAG TPA: glycosyl hydrolase [Patescibacteria group bacterium]|nr:glycosyl hydrolase [Patescibacteria group bacterium]